MVVRSRTLSRTLQRFSLAVAAAAEAEAAAAEAEAAAAAEAEAAAAAEALVLVEALGRDDAWSCEAERYHVHCSGSA